MTALKLSLAWLLLSASSPEPGPASLVEQLGSPRFADREAASVALARRGRDALAALRAGRKSADPEVRSRSEALVERIESDLLVRPTLVRLDFRDRPLSEVVAAVAERSQVPLAIFPENARALKARKVSLERPEPVPFWTALDLLCQAGDLQYNSGMPMGGFGVAGSRTPPLNLFQASPAIRPAPACTSGPFRVNLMNIHQERTWNFGQANGGGAPFGGLPNQPFGGGQADANEQFFVNLQVLAEPRLGVALNGPVKLLEAVDDLGQSLLVAAPPVGASFRHSAGYTRYDSFLGASLQVQAHLRYPEHPGRSIKRLRGTASLTVSARKDDPLTIPLAGSAGKTFKGGDATITIHEVKPEANPGQTNIDLSIQAGSNPQGTRGELFDGRFQAMPGNPQNQIEIIDARGKTLAHWYPISQNSSPDGLRMTIRVMAAEGAGVPAQVRYYELAKAPAEAEFLFEDIEMRR